jgi:predicted amidohydrolase
MKSSEDKIQNLKLSVEYIGKAAAKKASLICFPEFQMCFSPVDRPNKELVALAEPIKGGNFIGTLCNAAKSNKISVLATMYEKNNTKLGTNTRVYDTAVLINNEGIVITVYRKLHLYDALGFRESKKFVAGNRIERPSKTTVGKIGIMICYDLRFPEMSRILAVNGATILLVPSAWVHGIMKEEHWVALLRARAIENGSYIVAPDQIGNIYSGRSMVIDPFGVVILDMGNKEGFEIVEIDKERVETVRRSLPLLRNRRSDIYQKYIKSFS